MGRAHVRYTRRVVSLNLIAIHLQEEMCEQKLFLGSPQSHLRVSHKGEGELGKEKSARASASGCFTEAAVRILERTKP